MGCGVRWVGDGDGILKGDGFGGVDEFSSGECLIRHAAYTD